MEKVKTKGSGIKWWILHGIALAVDVVQILIDFTGIGIVISEALEVIMPPFIILYCMFILRISIVSHPLRLFSILGVTGLDAVTGGGAPFWILDTWYLQHDVKKEDARNQERQQEEEFLSGAGEQLYRGGSGRPRGRSGVPEQTYYEDGVGKPRGHIAPPLLADMKTRELRPPVIKPPVIRS